MVDCDNCGAYTDSPLAKEVCIHCFREAENEIKRLRKKLKKFQNDEVSEK